jgi:nicotinamide-nucleotide amidase
MNVEFVSIGDELLLGFTIDTNAPHLARAAAEQGIRVVRRATVGDGADGIAAAVREALDRTGAVITSGGLGPTADDLTKPAIAALFGRAMRRDDAIIESLRARWKARGWPGELPRTNEQQAMIPEGAVILENKHGSAPGIWLEDERSRWVAMLPGVPREFRGMTADTLLPRLSAMRARSGASSVVRSRTLRTTGIAESALADALGELAKDPHGVSLAYLPGWEGVDLRLTAWDLPTEEADKRLGAAATAITAKVGKHVYAEGEIDLVNLVLDRLRARGLKVAVAESCTGGMLGMRLTAIPGSSESVVGGIIAYDNAVKVRDLGVQDATLAAHGAVSEETAREMASGARARFGVAAALGITGIAGPGGGTPDKPVGTFCVAVDLAGEVRSLRTSTVGDRHEVRQRATQAALSLLRRLLDETGR